MALSRRSTLTGLAGLGSAGLIPAARAQSALTEEQRAEYARQFSTAGAARSELKILRDIQERRIQVRSATLNLNAFIANSPAMAALHAGTTPELGMLLFWNEVTLNATALDHTSESGSAPPATFAEQLGPTRSSRANAIVHLAMFEAVNTIHRRFASYNDLQTKIVAQLGVPREQISPATASVKLAILEAAYGTLLALYPKKIDILKAARDQSVVTVGDPEAAKQLGAAIGTQAAAAVLKLRTKDASDYPDLHAADFTTADPLAWGQDPISKLTPALGGNWYRVKPFVIENAAAFRPPPPPTVDDQRFVDDFKRVKQVGGDPAAPSINPRWPTPTTRTGTAASAPLDATNETFKAIFWAYDGTALLCAPPRLYNMVALSVALHEKPITRVEEMARYLALVNLGLADAGVAAWEAKYHYLFARPVTGIRALDADETEAGARVLNWTPLGAPVSNGKAENRNLTPPFPSYPSGHATFGGTLFAVMRSYWGLDEAGVPFDFVSDEYNGSNRGPGDVEPRPFVRRTFASFAEAETENAQSRVWLGIHWGFDADAGIAQGRQIGQFVVANALAPLAP